MYNTDENIIAFIGQKGIPKDFPGTSGVEAYVQQRAEFLFRRRKIVRCYTRRWTVQSPKKSYHGIGLIVTPSINTKYLDTISYSLLASVHASLSDTELVWYHGIGPACFAFIPKLFGKRVYTTIHSLDWNRKKWRPAAQMFLRVCERAAILLSDKIFVVSTQLKTYYKKRYHKNMAVDKYAIMKHTRVPVNIIYRRYHLVKNGYILYLGRFVPEKRIEWLIRTNPKIPNTAIVLAGGSSHTNRYERQLRSMAKKRNVIFTGYVFGREKAELLSNCKLFVSPSQLEGYSVSVAEALAYGSRCLIGDVFKPEYTSDNKLLYYFNSSSYTSFADTLKKLS